MKFQRVFFISLKFQRFAVLLIKIAIIFQKGIAIFTKTVYYTDITKITKHQIHDLINQKEEIIMKRMKKDNKGFTLVELIVVLVILAILAAILVPALLGYIDKAKEKQIVLNAKSCYTAAQAKYSELYAKDATTVSQTDMDEIWAMADVKDLDTLEVGTAKAFASKDHDSYTVSYIHYKDKDGEIWLSDGSWTTTEPTTKPANVQAITKSK